MHDDDLPTRPPALNARVRWHEGGKTLEGVVVAHVKTGELPSFRRFPQLFKRVCEDGPRLRDSFVVIVGDMALWPEPDHPTLVEEATRVKIEPLAPPRNKTPPRIKTPRRLPDGVVESAGACIAPTRPEQLPWKDPRTQMLYSKSGSGLKASFYPCLPHPTASYGPIFTGHIDGEKVIAWVSPAKNKNPLRLDFIRDRDSKCIGSGFLKINNNSTVSVYVAMRNNTKSYLVATHAAASMLARAMGVDYTPNPNAILTEAKKRAIKVHEKKVAEKDLA